MSEKIRATSAWSDSGTPTGGNRTQNITVNGDECLNFPADVVSAWSFFVLGISSICNLKGAEVSIGAYILALGLFQVVIGHIGIFIWKPVNAVEALTLSWRGIMVTTYASLLIVNGSNSNTAEQRKLEDRKKVEAIFSLCGQ